MKTLFLSFVACWVYSSENLILPDLLNETYTWRVVDSIEEQNAIFAGNKNSLISILIEALNKQKISYYEAADEQLKTPLLTQKTFSWKLRTYEPIDYACHSDTRYDTVRFFTHFGLKYLLKERLFFDIETKTMKTEILAIAPITRSEDWRNMFEGYEVLFWLRYSDIRALLAKQEVFGKEHLTWEQVFEKRLFLSYPTTKNKKGQFELKKNKIDRW